MSEEMDSMLDMYLYENGQLLDQLEMTTLEKKDADGFDEADINEFFRVMHTIKGSSGIMMFDNIMKLAHKLEDVFFYIRESHPDNVPHLELVDKIFAVADFFREEFENIKEDTIFGYNGDTPYTTKDTHCQITYRVDEQGGKHKADVIDIFCRPSIGYK